MNGSTGHAPRLSRERHDQLRRRHEDTGLEYPDMVHVWHLLRAMTPEGTRAIDEAGTFIRKHTRVL